MAALAVNLTREHPTDTQAKLLKVLVRATHVPAALVSYITTLNRHDTFWELTQTLLHRADLPPEQWWQLYDAYDKPDSMTIARAALRKLDEGCPPADVMAFVRTEHGPGATYFGAIAELLGRTPPGHPLHAALLDIDDVAWLREVARFTNQAGLPDLAAVALRKLADRVASGRLSDVEMARVRAASSTVTRMLENYAGHVAAVLRDVDTPGLVHAWLSDASPASLRGRGLRPHADELGRVTVEKVFVPVLRGQQRIVSFRSVENVAITFARTWPQDACLTLLAEADACTLRTKTGQRVVTDLRERATTQLGDLAAGVTAPADQPLIKASGEDPELLGAWFLQQFGPAAHDEAQWPAIMSVVKALGPNATTLSIAAAVAGVTA